MHVFAIVYFVFPLLHLGPTSLVEKKQPHPIVFFFGDDTYAPCPKPTIAPFCEDFDKRVAALRSRNHFTGLKQAVKVRETPGYMAEILEIINAPLEEEEAEGSTPAKKRKKKGKKKTAAEIKEELEKKLKEQYSKRLQKELEKKLKKR